MASGLDPVVQRRRLRVELRRAREAAGLSQKDVAPEMDWSMSKLMRIEAGTVAISVNDLRVLLQLYGITDAERIESLIGMARAAKEPAWWSSFRDPAKMTTEFSNMLSYESAASIIRNYEPLLMPGLLQTEDYARATLAEMVPQATDAVSDGRVDNLVGLRMKRQERLSSRIDRPKLFFALDEAVLYRWVGGPDVMRRQLERLKRTLQQPDTTIWIVPFSQGLYQRMRGSYVLLELPSAEENEDILYFEDSRGEWLIRDDLEETAIYLEAFWGIEQVARKNEEALVLVDRAMASLEQP
ncbi:helix-turn-helix domain-containing protein [Paractinoplanes atraurantiacus]|uniref:Helix-turn-helix domain-containing protein n=1 Tax=Paractinoplanes atraurantiacus TaxID=1036182 RepID=A0A285IR14_9ACTN|nr:helix-turn-helix transcriptional regulator [Actinoplanes atraurantiacus]SNY50273.1 Helix-turn-helix domain-containing protein [Actinoplanes atraurantiacus]